VCLDLRNQSILRYKKLLTETFTHRLTTRVGKISVLHFLEVFLIGPIRWFI
jgi:hypothetical protein